MYSRLLRWDEYTGQWWLCNTNALAIRGTTPRNAGALTLDTRIAKFDVWLSIGSHGGIDLWWGVHRFWDAHWTPPKCKCFSCRLGKR